MTLGSLFDGIGGWLLAARHAGVTPVWASEIEQFPCSVTAYHFPDVTKMGDITQIDPDEIEPVDIVCAGRILYFGRCGDGVQGQAEQCDRGV